MDLVCCIISSPGAGFALEGRETREGRGTVK